MFAFSLCGCGPDCWEARNDICRCSCGGRNHGIKRRTPTCQEVPLRRQMVWEDFLWELVKVSVPVPVGGEVCAPSKFDDEAQAANRAAGIPFLYAHTARKFYGGDFPVAHVRPFTDAQIAKWTELAAWRGPKAEASMALYGKPVGLWRRMDDLTARVKLEMARPPQAAAVG